MLASEPLSHQMHQHTNFTQDLVPFTFANFPSASELTIPFPAVPVL